MEKDFLGTEKEEGLAELVNIGIYLHIDEHLISVTANSKVKPCQELIKNFSTKYA